MIEKEEEDSKPRETNNKRYISTNRKEKRKPNSVENT